MTSSARSSKTVRQQEPDERYRNLRLVVSGNVHVYGCDVYAGDEIVPITLPSVTTILSKIGLTFDYSVVPKDVLAKAGARGSIVHNLCALWLAGDLDPGSIDPQLTGYFRSFVRFAKKYKLSAEASEFSVLNMLLGCAGTLDIYGDLDDERYILDLKTRKPEDGDGDQLAGYLSCLEWMGIAHKGDTRIAVVQLFSTGDTGLLFEYDPAPHLKIFEAACQIYRTREQRRLL